MSSVGERIRPEDLVDWLEERGLSWLCFCHHHIIESMSEEPHTTCQIGYDINGVDIGAYCHFAPSRCGFESEFP